jgi:hypothetical protein
METEMRTTTTCRKCGETIPGGTLLAHETAVHPRTPVVEPTKRARPCYRPACVDYYGGSHVVGVEGPHVY